jgi:hypothetical protein
LVIQADLFLDDANCVGNSPDQAWLVVKDSSKLFLPNEKDFGFTSGLDDFPYPFNKTPTLTDVLFALPEAPTIEEQTDLLRLIANLGSAVGENFMFPQVMISEASLVDSFENYHIIALGRPTRNTIIEQINDFLPQPFVPGSDEIQQRLDRVTFRVPADLDLGVIELIPSIWSETHTILAISGTTDTGVQWALQRLLTNSNALGRSDLALIKENQIESVDTRGVSKNDIAKAVATVVPELSPVPTETATASPLLTSTPSATLSQTPSQNSRPIWLIPLVVVNGLLVIVILGLAFWQTRRKRT